MKDIERLKENLIGELELLMMTLFPVRRNN
jgi:hypothetical protein